MTRGRPPGESRSSPTLKSRKQPTRSREEPEKADASPHARFLVQPPCMTKNQWHHADPVGPQGSPQAVDPASLRAPSLIHRQNPPRRPHPATEGEARVLKGHLMPGLTVQIHDVMDDS